MNLLELDEPFVAYLKEQPFKLKEAYSNIVSAGQLPIDATAVTSAILLRLRAYYLAQKEMMLFLRKTYAGSASDFFVETVLFYLRAFAETHQLGIEAASERKFSTPQGPLRPDISLWLGSQVIALVECKTQLGWNRFEWETDFLKRESRLRSLNDGAHAFLLVMTTKNWPGFGNSARVGKDYFVLSSEWPTDLDDTNLGSAIVTPIERMFGAIRDLVKGPVL